MTDSLVSIRQLTKNGSHVHFEDEGAKIVNAKNNCINAEVKVDADQLYKLHGHATNDERACIGRVVTEDLEGEAAKVARVQKSAGTLNLWHRRLVHLNEDDVLRLYQKGMVEGMEITHQTAERNAVCEPCYQGKQPREPIPKETNTRTTEVLYRIHSDLCEIGESCEGYRYYVTFIDDFSRYTEVVPLKHKDKTLAAFKKFIARAENELGKRVVRFRSDGGGKFSSKEFAEYCAEKGIVQEKTNPDTPQQNGVAERKNQTLNNKASSMLAGAHLTAKFWVSAIEQANWITNRSPSRAIHDDKTPFELYFNQKPSLLSLREFRCKAWVQIPKKHRAKFDHKSIECQYLGFAKGKKAFLLYDPAKRRVIESRDVKFHEDVNKDRIILSDDDENNWVEDVGASGDEKEAGVELNASRGDVDLENRSTTPPVPPALPENDEDTESPAPVVPPPAAPIPLRRSGRTRRAPMPDDDPKFFVGSRKPTETDAPGKTTTGTEDPMPEIADIAAFMSTTVDLAAFMSTSEPQSYREAMRREDASSWMEAMVAEMESQKKAGTFVEVPKPKGENILQCRWVFTYKIAANGQTIVYKARLVAKGFAQRPGEDFNETFAPTLHKPSLLTLFAIAAREDLEIDQMDIKTAFLHGDLDEEIFMFPPDGFPTKEPGCVWKLKKSIYGLKQAARMWYQKL